MFFNKKPKLNSNFSAENQTGFSYLKSTDLYFDSACQTLRPWEAILAEQEYYTQYNSCGHRVKYKWGEQTDRKVEQCRQQILDLVGKSNKEYTVAFGLNTTHGINTVLQQMPAAELGIQKIVTSEIEHNSVFLSSLTYAQRNNISRLVLPRNSETNNPQEYGNLIYKPQDLTQAIGIFNTQSNIDGQILQNAEEIGTQIQAAGGYFLLDACQTFGHNSEFLKSINFDACFGSGHKMYAQSVGFVIIKKTLLEKLSCYLIGGSTVEDVDLDSYQLVTNPNELYARIEPGLQNYAGIIGLNATISWLKDLKLQLSGKLVSKRIYEEKLVEYLHQKLSQIPKLKTLNPNPSPVVSLYSENASLDGHKIATYLSEVGIMGRSGYHCCHYYLKKKLNLPPLFRISLGLNNNISQIDTLVDKLKILANNL